MGDIVQGANDLTFDISMNLFQRQGEQLLWIRGRGGGGQVPTERAQLRLLQSEFDNRSVNSILRCN